MSEFEVVFAQLKSILQAHEAQLVVKADGPGNYSLDTHIKRADGYVHWFGGVQIKKHYVSYHLMPIYSDSGLLEGLSPELKKRMQGKACFNFKKLDQELFEELKQLTVQGYERFKAGGFA